MASGNGGGARWRRRRHLPQRGNTTCTAISSRRHVVDSRSQPSALALQRTGDRDEQPGHFVGPQAAIVAKQVTSSVVIGRPSVEPPPISLPPQLAERAPRRRMAGARQAQSGACSAVAGFLEIYDVVRHPLHHLTDWDHAWSALHSHAAGLGRHGGGGGRCCCSCCHRPGSCGPRDRGVSRRSLQRLGRCRRL